MADHMRADASSAFDTAAIHAGQASDLIGTMLATMADTVARLAYEAHHLAGLADDCNAAYTAQDGSAADSLAALAGEQP